MAFPPQTEARRRNIEAITVSYTHCIFGGHILSLKQVKSVVTRKRENCHGHGGKTCSLPDLSPGRLLHFSTLKKRQAVEPGRSIVTEVMGAFIKQPRDNFSTRFEDYSMPEDIAFVLDPLTVHPGGQYSSLAKKTIPSLDEAAIQTELNEFQTSSQIRDALRNASPCVRFGWHAQEYSTIKILAFYVLTMFGSTHPCISPHFLLCTQYNLTQYRLTTGTGFHISQLRSKSHPSHLTSTRSYLREIQLF